MDKKYMTVRELSVVYKIGKRKDDGKIGRKIINTEGVYRLFSDFGKKPREYLICIHLDVYQNIISYEIVSIGDLDIAVVTPRSVFQGAILSNAKSIILLHNHPSAEKLNISLPDIQVTKKLKEAGDIIGIEVVDHIIINSDSYISMRGAGDWELSLVSIL